MTYNQSYNYIKSTLASTGKSASEKTIRFVIPQMMEHMKTLPPDKHARSVNKIKQQQSTKMINQMSPSQLREIIGQLVKKNEELDEKIKQVNEAYQKLMKPVTVTKLDKAARSYEVGITNSQHPLMQLHGSNKSVENVFKQSLIEMKGYKVYATIKTTFNNKSIVELQSNQLISIGKHKSLQITLIFTKHWD